MAVSYFAYPKLEESTPFNVTASQEDCDQIEESAASEGLEVVGMIHSHPGAPAYMSKFDRQVQVYCKLPVMGIVQVRGEKKRTEVVFWEADTSVPAILEYFA